jgi:hypothetical protein
VCFSVAVDELICLLTEDQYIRVFLPCRANCGLHKQCRFNNNSLKSKSNVVVIDDSFLQFVEVYQFHLVQVMYSQNCRADAGKLSLVRENTIIRNENVRLIPG